jgi:NTP pyrophosphatase (non-canonical NTP hydrolase)
LREIAKRVEKLSRAKNREKTLGEVLFALAAYAAAKHVDAEGALRKVVNRKDLTGF